MSKFSGRCDLYDHMMMCKMYDRPHCKVSDELECFNIFKERTGGILRQHRKITLTDYNIKKAVEACPQLEIISGNKKSNYVLNYFGSNYSMKELNKKGVYITVEIKFDTLLDLIPYYPYVISIYYGDKDKEIVYISTTSEVDELEKSSLDMSCNLGYSQRLRKSLQEHYLDIFTMYYDKENDKRTITEKVDFDENGKGYTSYHIDPLFGVEYYWKDNQILPHWTSLKFIKDNEIQMSKEDCEHYLKGKEIWVKYLVDVGQKLYLE